jgi:hypothetical protein
MMRTFVVLVGGGLGYLFLMPIVIAGLPFWLIAMLTRRLEAWFSPRAVPWNEMIEFDAIVGWKPKPNVYAICEAPGADLFRVKTDQEGWRGPASLEESEVVVFGDSFAFGYPVNRPFFDVSTPDVRIKAIAADGYNMVQELLLMSQHAPRLGGKVVVWFVYAGNDLTDNLSPSMWGYRQPFLLQSGDDWEIFSKHVQPAKWPLHPRFDRNGKITAVFGTNTTSERVYNACEYLISHGKTLCDQAGAHLIVLTIPWTIQYEKLPWTTSTDKTLDPDLPERKIADICARFRVPFVSGKQHFSLRHFIPNEGHLNEKGHKHLAKIIGEVYQTHRQVTHK